MQKIIKMRLCRHKGFDYETRAIIDLSHNVVRVEILHNNAPVVFTFADGSKATRPYDVDFSTRMDGAQAWDCDAIEDMMNIAETDFKATIR
jgi:hypothetical protein